MEKNLIVAVSPHIHNKESVNKIMWTVVLCLIPSGIAGIFIFGLNALAVIILGIVSALATEALIQAGNKKKITILNGSAFLTGLLLAYNLPPGVPYWIPIIGSVFAITIGKHIFGGLGQNIFNPALAGRAFLMASWPKHMTSFIQPLNHDALTAATPLAFMKETGTVQDLQYLDLFLGKRGGCIGEVCIVALILAGAYLLLKGYISWHIPFTFVATVAFLTWVFDTGGFFQGDWLFHILTGGLILGAFFMATDYVTSPLTRKGQLIFGAGCGILTSIIRLWGGYPEGVSYSILIMNAVTPLIDRYTKNRIYGTVSVNADT